MFVGRALNRFLYDAGGYMVALRLDCLQQKFGVTDCIFKEHNQSQQDIETFPIADIICGPLKAKFLGGGKWEIPQYHKVRTTFERIKKQDQVAVHQAFVCKQFSKED